MIHRLLFLIASASLMAADPVGAQSVAISNLPVAQPLNGTERMPAVQNGQPVAITPDRIVDRAKTSLQPLDPDLTAIAALQTTGVGRDLLTSADATAVRGKAGLGSIATQNASSIAITGGSIVGITDLALADGGTGASTAAGARANLLAAASGANSDITALSGLTSALSLGQGGTGATSASDARTSLGLGSIATQPASGVSITGGSIAGIVDLAISDGGTGASTASVARTNLGLDTMATQSAASVAITGGSITANAIRQTGNSFLRIEGTGSASPAGITGPGFNIFAAGGTAYLEAYSYGPNGYIPLRFNGSRIIFSGTIGVRLSGLPTYATDAAAGTGGLVTDDVYKTSTGELRIKL